MSFTAQDAPSSPFGDSWSRDSWASNSSWNSSPERTYRRHWRRLVSAALVVTVIAAAFVTADRLVARSVRERARHSLTASLAAHVMALEMWLDERRDDVEHLIRQGAVHRGGIALLEPFDKSGGDVRDEADSDRQTELASFHGALADQLVSPAYLGWVLIDLRGRVVAASHDAYVAHDCGLPEDVLRRLEAGSSAVGRPFPNPVVAAPKGPLSRTDHSIMLALAPMRIGVRSLGALGLILDPMDRFSQLLSAAQTGGSDQTYAFDREGFMLTGSRFEALLRVAMLQPGDPRSTAPLRIRLVDPGVDLTRGVSLPTDWQSRPLTWMADHATRGSTAYNVKGYRDYRGVMVVGAWQWLPTYQIGVATEVDLTEAVAPLSTLRQVWLALLGFAACCGVTWWGWHDLRHRFGRTGRADSGRQLGHYEVESLIGRGGMGSVYRAQHRLLGRKVAIKVLENEDVTEKSISRFQREVQLTAGLKHPNTIDIYDFGCEQNGTFFYVMEYVDGLSLMELVQEFGRQPPQRVIDLLVQACRSLAEAHGRGMVHRDIKPANLLITAQAGQHDLVKVVDFGLVKEINRETVQLTQSDAITGSPHFMSPEAIRNVSRVDATSDLYSLGAVGYFLLTGTYLFAADSRADICARQLHEDPVRPEQVAGETLPDDLQNVLMSCLCKDPRDRPQSADDMAAALLLCRQGDSLIDPLWCWSDTEAARWWSAFFAHRQTSQGPHRGVTGEDKSP